MSETKRVVIMSAIPGGGKTTHARKVVEQNGGVGLILSVDAFFTNPTTGNYEFKPHLLQQAHAENMKAFIEAVQRGESLIIVDNANTSLEQIAPFYAVAKAYGIRNVGIVLLKCPLSIALKRNIHGVPPHNIQQHHERFKQLRIPKTWKVNVEEIHVDANE